MATMNRILTAALSLALCVGAADAWARDVNYDNGEITVRVNPGEPTQVQFPGKVSGGFKRSNSAVELNRQNQNLVIISTERLPATGEALIVNLDDGRSYSMRVMRATADQQRDDTLIVHDERGAMVASAEEENPQYKDRSFDYAPSTQVAGLMREMVLAAEFGKKAIPGYRVSEQHKGETVLNDGTMAATVDRIFIGPNLWGYVLDTKNLLETSQKVNPAAFRLDGTRAVSAEKWQLGPVPMNVEQQLANQDHTKVYIITRAKK